MLLALVLLPALTPAQVLKIGMSDTNRVALSYADGRFGGSLAPLYQCALDNSGLDYELLFFPQVRVLHLLEHGEIDLGLPLARLDDRDLYAVFTRPLAGSVSTTWPVEFRGCVATTGGRRENSLAPRKPRPMPNALDIKIVKASQPI